MDRKILASMLIIAVASMLIGAGTVAYFSDTETSKGNTFTVSTESPNLELSPCGTQPYLPFDVEDIKPGHSGVADVNVSNIGTAAGWLSMKLINCVNDENGLLEPEIEAGDTTADEGELDQFLYLIIWFDDNNDGVKQPGWRVLPGGEQPIIEGYFDGLCGIKIPIDGDPTYDKLKPGMTWTIGIKWSLASEVGNIIQSDSLSFDVEFTLSESGP
jgi:predicted ribosomally synthesized peptide with SipW-like signal peptide